ncbi:MAG: BrnT family toxin [Thermoanaerobaculia bacterium]
MRFQYDPAKAASNFRKHGVSFTDAEGVFYDPLALHGPDSDAEGEERFVAVYEG